MSTPVWKWVWDRDVEAKRWRNIATALDILASEYEFQNGTPAIADLSPHGVTIQTEVDGQRYLELLSPNVVAQLSPEAYAALRQSKAVGECIYNKITN